MGDEQNESSRALAGPSRGALDPGQDSGVVTKNISTCDRLLAQASPRLGRIHRQQVGREPWPDFANFDRASYSLELRREAARHWARRAVAEYGSIHQFSSVTHILCEAQVGLEFLGPLARLLTDEVRHAELCAQMAITCDPEGPQASPHGFRWEAPVAPWPAPPTDGGRESQLAWAARAILVACCLGETISRPMYEALLVVCTDPVCAQVLRQIQRDEHLHAAFGWDVFAMIWPTLSKSSREQLQRALSQALGGFESTTACGYTIADVTGRALEITRGVGPNLGILASEQYAMIFFATVEQELFPALEKVGLDPHRAWADRPSYRATTT